MTQRILELVDEMVADARDGNDPAIARSELETLLEHYVRIPEPRPAGERTCGQCVHFCVCTEWDSEMTERTQSEPCPHYTCAAEDEERVQTLEALRHAQHTADFRAEYAGKEKQSALEVARRLMADLEREKARADSAEKSLAELRIRCDDLHVYWIDPNCFIARDEEDALAVREEYYRTVCESEADPDVAVQALPDDGQRTIINDGERETRTNGEWSRIAGRGFLCSTEW